MSCMESEEMSTAEFKLCDDFDHLDDDWKVKAISDWSEKTGYFPVSNNGQGMEGPSERENNGYYDNDWLEKLLSEWDIENGNSVCGQGIKGPSELEKNGDSVLNSGQGMEGPSELQKNRDSVSNSRQDMEGPSDLEKNGDSVSNRRQDMEGSSELEKNGDSVSNSGQGMEGPSEWETNGDSVSNSRQDMEGPSDLEKNGDSDSNSRQDMEGSSELEKNGDSVSNSGQGLEGPSELEKNGDSVSNSGQGMEGPSKWETNGDSLSNSGRGKERPADLGSSVGSNVVPSSQHFPAWLSEESRSTPSDSSDANDRQIRSSLMSVVTVKSAQHTALESQESAADVHQINHPNSNMESEEIPGNKLNLSESSDDGWRDKTLAVGEKNGDFVLKNRLNFKGPFRFSVVSNVVPSSQHCPPRLSEEFRSPSSEFSDGSDNQIRSSSSDVNVISAQHAVLEIQQSAASDIYQITNPDSNMEEAIPSDIHNLFDDSDKILAEGEKNGDFVINNCQGVEGPFGLQPDLSIVSSVVSSSQYFPAQLWKEISSPSFFSFTDTDSDSQIRTSSSDVTVKPAQHTVLESHKSPAAEVYQINHSDSNMEEDDMFNLSDDSEEDWLDKELAEGEKRGDFVLKFQQGVKGSFGLQLDFSGVSNGIPSSQHFPAQLCEEMRPPSFSSFPYTGNYSQIRTSWSDVTENSAQHSVLESHKSGATEVYQIKNPDSTMEEAIPDDMVNLSDDSEEDWLDKELAEGEKNGDFVIKNRQGVEGSFGLQLDFSVVSNVLPSNQHFPARVSEFRSPISDFSGANICLESEEAMNMDSPIATWDSKPNNTAEALGVVLGALPHLQSDFGGHSLPLITNIAFPPDLSDNSSPFHALPGSEPHVGCNSTDVGLQSPEAITLGSPIASTAKTWADYRKIEPKLHHSRVMDVDPFETEKFRICKKQMKTIFNKKIDGLAQKLTAIVDSYKRCRDERKPIHIKVWCALEDDTTAITCCWSQTFGACFPDDNVIMKTFNQVITRIVNMEIKARDNVATSDDVNKRCDEWFQSQLDVGPTRTDLKIRGKNRAEAINKLALSLKIPADQVVRKWSAYRRRISRERLEAKCRTERLGLVDHRIETLEREITDKQS